MVKKIVLLAVLALALPLAAFASSSIDTSNSGGTLTGTSSGLSLSGSTLTQVTGLFGSSGLIQGSNLGSVSFSTGALTSGSLSTSCSVTCVVATFAGGGSFTISGNGSNGVPNGVIFSGTFSGPVTVIENPSASNNGTASYTITGALSGTLYTGFKTVAATSQITVFVHKGTLANGATISSGDTTIVVPEPGTLSLFGTGLIGLAGLVRRKLNLV
jgi:hypothetical protein